MAIECCRKSLVINALYPGVWFLMGTAAMEKENPDYSIAVEAFTNVVNIDPDNFEGWNNLGACHMYQQHWKAALNALNNASELRRESWQVFENLLTISLKLHDVTKSISSLIHLLELQQRIPVKAAVIAEIIKQVLIQMSKFQEQSKKNLKPETSNDTESNKEKEQEKTIIEPTGDTELDTMLSFFDNVEILASGNSNNDDDDEDEPAKEQKDQNVTTTDSDAEMDEQNITVTKESLALVLKQFERLEEKLLENIHVSLQKRKLPNDRQWISKWDIVDQTEEKDNKGQVIAPHELYELLAQFREMAKDFVKSIDYRQKQKTHLLRIFLDVNKNVNKTETHNYWKLIVYVLRKLCQLYVKRIDTLEFLQSAGTSQTDTPQIQENIVLELKKIRESLTDIRITVRQIGKHTQVLLLQVMFPYFYKFFLFICFGNRIDMMTAKKC
ncbi:TPR domain-containing protein [Reticulomyxa filosa]|uniref:TPR domain-containing protein n=1 Tax=Reticulomyxa filosa TaxID=46433 RepID=X6M5P9_RETFI|nr:TPR domain-containing protein [Reticulomyxa filosa]|eukprot:ETO09318.1 TPR domain-containing protein [Reticulomyxa filosa]